MSEHQDWVNTWDDWKPWMVADLLARADSCQVAANLSRHAETREEHAEARDEYVAAALMVAEAIEHRDQLKVLADSRAIALSDESSSKPIHRAREEIVEVLTSMVAVLDEEPGAHIDLHPRVHPQVDVDLPDGLELPSADLEDVDE